MTTEARASTATGIDFGAVDDAIGLNWYDADPNLRNMEAGNERREMGSL